MQSLAINKLLRMAPCGGTGGRRPERAGGYVTSTQFRVRSMAFFQPA
jgi:hypothetical protein